MSKATKVSELDKLGYAYMYSIEHTGKGKKGHVLLNMSDGNFELWYSNKNANCYTLPYRNTRLEFACSIKN